jgi:hypothetical protein
MTASGKKPPLNPKGSNSSGSSNSRNRTGSSNTSSSKRSKNSNSPSASSNNEHGREVLDDRLRSVFADRLGLPLLYEFHDFKHHAICEQLVGNKENRLKNNLDVDSIFQTIVEEWRNSLKSDNESSWEKLLTKKLSEKINSSKIGFNSFSESTITDRKGHIDMVFSTAETKDGDGTTPLAVIEFGLNSDDWWKKLDQNVKYVEYMCAASNKNKLLVFKKEPFLLVVITIGDESRNDVDFKIGVFLCSPRDLSRSEDKDFRLSLLWRSKKSRLNEASKEFGKLLRVTSDFEIWRMRMCPPTEIWEYFGSNCCRVGDKVSELFYLEGTSNIANSDSGFFC